MKMMVIVSSVTKICIWILEACYGNNPAEIGVIHQLVIPSEQMIH